MTRHIAQLVAAAALIAAAILSWRAAASTRDLAAHEERLFTFQESSDYWSGRYDAVSAAASADDGDTLRAAANAAYRKVQRESSGAPSVEGLDRVLQAYTSALKNSRFSQDVAYNFEYVARLRDVIAKTPRRPAKPSAAATTSLPDDLPTGRTLHGEPGVHPPSTRGEEFEVLTPMDYGEREAQPEPTPGRPLPRKG
jgi:hypothetical protein